MKTLKLFVLALILFPVVTMAQNTQVKSFFDKHMGQDGYTTVKITKKMFEMLATIEIEGDEEAEEMMEMVRNIDGINIIASEGDGNKTQLSALFNELNAALPSNYYEDLVVVESEDEHVRIMVKEGSKGIINELMILANDGEDLALVSITGKINLAKIGKMASSMNINGMEHLSKLSEECDK